MNASHIKLSISNNQWYLCGRRASLELILPRAQLFQEGVDGLQQWLISVEQDLAELRNAERVMLHVPEATQRAKVGIIPANEWEFHTYYTFLYFCFELRVGIKDNSKKYS